MPPARPIILHPDTVYRTKDFAIFGRNPSRLAHRLMDQGRIEPLAPGLFLCPKVGRFGKVPPRTEEVFRAFLEGSPFVLTGPSHWNALGLGTTALFAKQLVYNTKRTGEFSLGGQSYWLRRIKFPPNPPVEWYVVDLFEHASMAGASEEQLVVALTQALDEERFSQERLFSLAKEYGTQRTQAAIQTAISQVARQAA